MYSGYLILTRYYQVPHKSVGKLCATIKDLKEDSNYDFRVAAVNSSGQGRWMETTKPIVAMDAPGRQSSVFQSLGSTM